MPKVMIQFCHWRLYLSIETVSCRLLQRMAMMGLNWNVKIWATFFKIKYSQTPLCFTDTRIFKYKHLIITDSLLCTWAKKALAFSLKSTRLIQHPVNTDTFCGPSMSVLTGFDCTIPTKVTKKIVTVSSPRWNLSSIFFITLKKQFLRHHWLF